MDDSFKVLEVLMKLAKLKKKPHNYSVRGKCWFKGYQEIVDRNSYFEKGPCSGQLIVFISNDSYCIVCEKHKITSPLWTRFEL